MTDPEKTHWVRYAADCAEQVVDLAGMWRSEAWTAIRAARGWADAPTPGGALAAISAAFRAEYVDTSATPYAVYYVIRAAASAARAAVASNAAPLAGYAADYSIRAVVASGNGSAVESVRAWQAERRRHYGLEGR